MGAFFGVVSKKDCISDVFFGTDYHSHLGTKSAGISVYNPEKGIQRKIHNLGNSPFRTKFEKLFSELSGTSAIGVISDYDPQPLIIKSRHGVYAICFVGIINNQQDLIDNYLMKNGYHFGVASGGEVNAVELIATLIDSKPDFLEGLAFAKESIEGTANLLILREDGSIIASRDKKGRLPIHIGKGVDGYAIAFENFSYQKLGYEDFKELGSNEVVRVSVDGVETLVPASNETRICTFLWTYYGYPTSNYEGLNVELMRYKNGKDLAESDCEKGNNEGVDYVCGVPDSGTPHAIGYSHSCGIPFARPYIKYTPSWYRSFMPEDQRDRNKIAKMKQIPVKELIQDKSLLFVDDSIVRGTQLRETVEFLFEHGAKAVHMRSACPPIMFGCKYLNFSRATSDMELITRRVIMELEGPEGFNHLEEYADSETERGKKMRQAICDKFGFDSIEFQSLDRMIKAMGVPECKLCTYCWNGKE